LANADARGRAGDAALGHEGVEGDEQVEVEPSEISVIDSHYDGNLLD
jgi:hypothetical protein